MQYTNDLKPQNLAYQVWKTTSKYIKKVKSILMKFYFLLTRIYWLLFKLISWIHCFVQIIYFLEM